jgi:hypothetical protein
MAAPANKKGLAGRRLMVETINKVLKNFVHTNDKKLKMVLNTNPS